MTKEHWAEAEAARKRLVKFGKDKGLDVNGILEVLGIEKLSEYKGTEAEAVVTLAQWATDNEPPEPQTVLEPAYQTPPVYKPIELDPEDEERYAEAIMANMPSVPVWIRMDGRCNYEISVQAWLPPELTRVGLAYARQALEDYQTIFADVLIDTRNGNGQAPAQVSPPASSGNGHEDLTFQATELVGSMTGGKTYWNVLGPRFPQYGVRIWPEILKASGFDPEELDAAQTYPLPGYTATYVEKEKDDKIIPDKVISLTKAA